MTTLNVHFLNRGYDTDYGVKKVELLGQSICEFTGKPVAEIRSPFGLGGSLVAEYSTHAGAGGWVCDLDQETILTSVRVERTGLEHTIRYGASFNKLYVGFTIGTIRSREQIRHWGVGDTRGVG